MTAIKRSMVKIAILAAGTAPTDVAATDFILGEIKNYSKSGGERDTESDPHFGGYVDKEKPVSQIEVSFEVTPSIDAVNVNRWDELAYTKDVTTGVYHMAGDVADKAVFIQAQNGSLYKSWCFNNCNVTMFDIEHNADDVQTGNFNLKFSPEDADGISNFMTVDTSLAAFPVGWTLTRT